MDVTQFCNDLCIGQNVAMIHAEPTGFAVHKIHIL